MKTIAHNTKPRKPAHPKGEAHGATKNKPAPPAEHELEEHVEEGAGNNEEGAGNLDERELPEEMRNPP
ncbi:MAG TPA: hypothetical protein VHL57_07050, partial [Flavobacteriales bacterium]|nr:hypothetical protein [Flavobacteriales bacterium]